jgi:alcohol dehydrogenase (cytochrome c)
MLAGVTIAALPALAAEVTPERLINADREPQNWLMNHRTYDSQRYSPLDKINKVNVKSLKIAYAVAIGGTSANENLEATPLADDGFLYLTDQWACSTRSTAARVMWVGSCGAWTRGRRRLMRRTVAPHCGEIS